MYLLDVNALIALADPLHEHHARAKTWFFSEPRRSWATCPLTENGFLRVLGHPSYPEFAGGTAGASGILARMCLAPGHQFWPDAISLRKLPANRLPGSRHLTDIYLLALALHRHGQLATLDTNIPAECLTGGQAGLFVIP